MFPLTLKKNLLQIFLSIGIGSISVLLYLFPVARPVSANGPTSIYSEEQSIRFAVVGDFGRSGINEAKVATLVKSWNPNFIVTTGDNNYSYGSRLTIDKNIGQYYHEYIGTYSGSYGNGAIQNRFFPTLGNHDWRSIACFSSMCYGSYLGYFSLPGNERYYDFIWGPVHFFVLDSDPREPDGVSPDSKQGHWLKERLGSSSSPWNIVVLHHSPYSSARHGSVEYMQWPFQQWGADAVLSGHDHVYERVVINNFPFFVNGLGGGSLYEFKSPVLGSQIRFNKDYGAMLVEGDSQALTFKFITQSGGVVDEYTLRSMNTK